MSGKTCLCARLGFCPGRAAQTFYFSVGLGILRNAMVIYVFDSNVNLVGENISFRPSRPASPLLSKYVYKLRVQKSRPKLRKKWPDTVPNGPLRGGTAARGTTSREAVPRGYSFSGYRLAGGTALRECRMATFAGRGAASWAPDAEQKCTFILQR